MVSRSTAAYDSNFPVIITRGLRPAALEVCGSAAELRSYFNGLVRKRPEATHPDGVVAGIALR